MSDALGEARLMVSFGAKLLRNGCMRDDDAWNCGSVIRPDENGRRGSGISTIVHGDTQETDTDGMMRVMTGIKEGDVGALEGTIGKQKMAIVGSAGHRAVVGVCKRKLAGAVVRFCETTKQDRIRSNIKMDGFGGG